MTVRTVGVEEELMLVDPGSGMVTGVATRALRAHEEAADSREATTGEAPVEAELFTQQIETQTPPCAGLDELATELRRGRRSTCEAATAAGAAAVAMAAPVLMDGDTEVSPTPRYRRIREEFGELAGSALVSAMHVHVDVGDDVDGVAVLDGLGPWLPVLLAISANSPFAHGSDTGYASWRSQVWSRWPSNGTGERFGDRATYGAVAEQLIGWGAALDEGMLYLDARLSPDHPTVEVRVADVATEIEDTLLVAALTRALVETCTNTEQPVAGWRSDLLRAARWRASRYGIAGELVDPVGLALVPARDAIGTLVDHVRPALEEAGDLDLVTDTLERVIARGNGAIQQRRVLESTGDLAEVVADCRRRTAAAA